jgi:hypothetical protein
MLRYAHLGTHWSLFALLPQGDESSYGAVMSFVNSQSLMNTDSSDLIARQNDPTDDQARELKELLTRYFEIGWKIATRLEHEGRLDEVLTKAGVNPTVKPPRTNVAPFDPLAQPEL